MDWRKLLSGVGGMFENYSPSSEYVKQVQLSDDAIEQAEWQKIIQSWAYDMAPASTAGQAIKAPALLAPVDQLVGKAPVGDLYGGHDVSSIVNLRKRKERGFA
jgi:hypothetical protein